MVSVQTPSRLHFGLLSLAPEGSLWPDLTGRGGVPARRYGGVGLMVDRPGVRVRAEPAPSWSAGGPLAGRALEFARRFADGFGPEAGRPGPPQRLTVEHAAPEHAGLGTGTQLGLAVARAVASAWGLAMAAPELARRVGRGYRSALGVHGFERGGLLVDGGKRAGDGPAPLLARVPFPAGWRVVVAIAPGPPGLHGEAERQAFARLAGRPAAPGPTDALCRLALLGLLPAALEADLPAFGEALTDFNAWAGELFAEAQGGAYAGPAARELVAFLLREGAAGAGQSSWGPAVFGVTADGDEAAALARRVRDRFGGGVRVEVCAASEAGARAWEG
jgi:beta-RFAP synthase